MRITILSVALLALLTSGCKDSSSGETCQTKVCPAGFTCVKDGPFYVCKSQPDGALPADGTADTSSAPDGVADQAPAPDITPAEQGVTPDGTAASFAVVSSDPADGAQRVDLRATLKVTFNAELDASTLAATSFAVTAGANVVGGALSYDAPSRTVTFTPSQILADGVQHTITLTTALKSKTGVALAPQQTIAFTTASWEAVTGSGMTGDIYSVQGHATKVYFAAGFQRLYSYDGSTFTAESTWPPAGAFHGLYVAAANNIWACGSGNSGMHHFDGTLWTRESAINLSSIPLWSVNGLGSYVIAAGIDANVWRLHNGAWVKWNDRSDPSIFNMAATFNDVWMHASKGVTPARAYLVGLKNGNSQASLFRATLASTLTTWSIATGTGAPTTTSLYGVWGTAADDIIVVGDKIASRFDGTQWTAQAIPGLTGILRDVWGTGKDDVYVVGDGGMLAHWNGTSWAKLPTHTTETLRSVWGPNSKDVWAVGSGGTILRYRR